MRVALKDITSALAKVKGFTSDIKSISGVLFRVKENELDVCFSNGKKSIIEKIDAVNDSSDYIGDIVLSYNRIMDIIDVCQPTGKIFVDEVYMDFKENNIIVVKAQKKMVRVNKDGEDVEKVISNFEQSISWVLPTDSLKYNMLTRMEYEDIFSEGEAFDTWNTQEFAGILAKTTSEKTKNTYFSSSRQCAFVVNLAYTLDINMTERINLNMAISSATAKALVDVLGKMGNDKDSITITSDGKYCNIYSEDKKVGMWFELSAPTKTDVDAIDRYREKEYKTYQMNFVTEALQNVIKSAITSDKMEKTSFRFVKDESGQVSLEINSINSGASIKSNYDVACDKCVDETGTVEELELPVSLKVIESVLSNCKTDFVAFDVEVDEDEGKFIRISEVKENITGEEENREDFFNFSSYMVSSLG